MSDNRDLYIHLDTMTPLRLEENSLSRSQMGIQDHDGALETPQPYMDYDYHEYFETLYTTTPVKTSSTTTQSSLPPSVFFATFSTRRTTPRTIPTVKSSTQSETSTVGRYPLFYKNNDNKDSEMEIFETIDEVGNSSEILRNLSVIFPEPRPGNASGSTLLQCEGDEAVCTAVNVLIFLMIITIVIIVLCLYFDPRKCAESLKNSDRVIL